MQNFIPSNLRASSNKKKLMLKYVYCTGKPVAQYTIEAIPGTPPVVISFGSRKTVQPMPYKIMPMAIIT